jgi:hypothetical protein
LVVCLPMVLTKFFRYAHTFPQKENLGFIHDFSLLIVDTVQNLMRMINAD